MSKVIIPLPFRHVNFKYIYILVSGIHILQNFLKQIDVIDLLHFIYTFFNIYSNLKYTYFLRITVRSYFWHLHGNYYGNISTLCLRVCASVRPWVRYFSSWWNRFYGCIIKSGTRMDFIIVQFLRFLYTKYQIYCQVVENNCPWFFCFVLFCCVCYVYLFYYVMLSVRDERCATVLHKCVIKCRGRLFSYENIQKHTGLDLFIELYGYLSVW